MKINPTIPAGLPPLAVVVIGRNEGQRLIRCLMSVHAMNYPPELLHLIYVDSASTDQSVPVARAAGFEVVELDGKTTAARARNIGWRRTDAPFVLFLDGDTILDSQFVRKALPHFADASLAGLSGIRRELDCAGSMYNAIFDLDWPTRTGEAAYFGGDALVRTEALRSVCGYSASLIAGEEPDLCRRMRALGYKILRVDAPMTLHDLRMSRFSQYWRRSLRTGHAYAEVSSMYAATSDRLWSAESRRNLTRGVFWCLSPAGAVALALILGSALPVLAFLFVAAALFLRNAWSIRRRASEWKTRLVYGFHCQLQHVPIFFGQIRYWMRNNSSSSLIEYKDPT